MRRPLLLGLAAAALLLVAGGAAGYAYFFSGLRSAPKPLALSTPSPAPISPAASGGLAGAWTVASGSLARYRVQEQFAGQTSQHEAVAQTTAVSGGLTVQPTGSGLAASGLQFTAQLSQLQSVDQVAGFNVSQRDRLVTQSLAVSQYPTATFQAASVAVPAGLDSGGQVTVNVPGQLTIHGTTRPATFAVTLQQSGGQVQAVGRTQFDMSDFGVSAPRVPITTVQPQVTIEFQLNLARA